MPAARNETYTHDHVNRQDDEEEHDEGADQGEARSRRDADGSPDPEVRRNDLLVKVHAAAVCGTDIHIYQWNEYAASRIKLPLLFGHEFAAEVVEVGKNAGHFKKGDRVAAETHIPCGHCFQCTTGLQHVCRDMYLVTLSLTRHAGAVFRAVVERDVELWAPDLIYPESTSALRRLVALRAIDGGTARAALQHLLQLPIVTTGTKALMEAAWGLRESVKVYDACYAALAHALDAPLVTADRRLVRALRQIDRPVTFLGDVA